MYELSLFAGAGGGMLGTALLGWTPVGYVEWDDYCQRIIAQRIADGFLPRAPIFGDIRAFTSDGYAASYTGMVDVVTAGFPCQPHSVAGKQKGADDERDMWPATIDVIRIVRPAIVLLENVPGIVSNGYIFTVLGDLAKAGYQAFPPFRFGADDVGANHRRKRIWIVAYSKSAECECAGNTREWRDGFTDGGDVCDASGARLAQRIGKEGERTFPATSGADWWTTEPGMGRVANGVAHRVDRLKAIGNGQVPAMVATVWQLLEGR